MSSLDGMVPKVCSMKSAKSPSGDMNENAIEDSLVPQEPEIDPQSDQALEPAKGSDQGDDYPEEEKAIEKSLVHQEPKIDPQSDQALEPKKGSDQPDHDLKEEKAVEESLVHPEPEIDPQPDEVLELGQGSDEDDDETKVEKAIEESLVHQETEMDPQWDQVLELAQGSDEGDDETQEIKAVEESLVHQEPEIDLQSDQVLELGQGSDEGDDDAKEEKAVEKSFVHQELEIDPEENQPMEPGEGSEHDDEAEEKSLDASDSLDEMDEDVMFENKKEYTCKYCNKKFQNCQALGGHQNAHKHERDQRTKKPYKLIDATFANVRSGTHPLSILPSHNSPRVYLNRPLGVHPQSGIHKPFNSWYRGAGGHGYGAPGGLPSGHSSNLDGQLPTVNPQTLVLNPPPPPINQHIEMQQNFNNYWPVNFDVGGGYPPPPPPARAFGCPYGQTGTSSVAAGNEGGTANSLPGGAVPEEEKEEASEIDLTLRL